MTIPEDVMTMAREIAGEINASIDPIENVEVAIADAILAERERCAKIAQGLAELEETADARFAGRIIAAAIRKGSD